MSGLAVGVFAIGEDDMPCTIEGVVTNASATTDPKSQRKASRRFMVHWLS
jgi:hypothetical protein